MRLDRLQLATQVYAEAVTQARARPTPASWRRLVTAGRNLRDARAWRRRMFPGAATEARVDEAPRGSRVLPFPGAARAPALAAPRPRRA